MFDLDGTLFDTAAEIAESANRTLRDYGLPEVGVAQVRDWIGHGTGWMMTQAWTSVTGRPDPALWPEVMEKFIGHYFDCAGTSSRPYPDVPEALEALKRLGVKRAIVTNKETRFTQRILQQHAMADHFDLVISGDTYSVKKPDPTVIYNCMQAFSVSAGECLFVGDSHIDVATARAAGVMCWVVPYGYNMGQPIASANPDRIVPTMKEVPLYFKGLQ
ncbi:MAG: HAD-IA family hydrolase [Burkholderiaceae bacterium]|nr:HAD-IA family hydrolase [Burkholderiaceae bacterium]